MIVFRPLVVPVPDCGGPRFVSWTGGDKPRQLSTISRDERQCVRGLFRWHMIVHANYWGSVDGDRARRFWKWARYDAHATFRQ